GTLSAGGNYTFDFDTDKTFAITPATLTVTPNDNQSKIYGEVDPMLTYTVSGWKGSDSESLFSGALARAAGENVNTYAINAGTLSAGGNYTFDFDTDKTFAITPKEVSVDWTNTTLLYNGAAQKPIATAIGVLDETIALSVSGEQTEIGTGYIATADFETPSANYVLTNTSVVFEIVSNPDYAHTVTFNSQDGSDVASQTVEHGALATSPTNPTRIGYTFGGWFKEANCTNEWNFTVDAVTSDITLYAKWTVIIETESSDANLRLIFHSAGTMSPEFDASITTYTINVANVVEHIDIRGEVSHHQATITGNVANMPLVVGNTNIVVLTVTAEDGSQKVYTITIVRAACDIDNHNLYIHRWSDVLAINTNTATNGGYIVGGVRWYKGDEFIGTGEFIEINGDVSNYKAQVEIAGEWKTACMNITRSITQILAYPNPVARGENLILELPENYLGSTLDIYSISGAPMKQKIMLHSAKSIFNASDLSQGIYLFRITSVSGNVQTIKIIIN
ncbi:MAG: InlB B-repeat-containing protein, partial [Prevotellaceae bacterium]|nr:InlB B-repeat-containing protein [Prevotellaceae bacterium]